MTLTPRACSAATSAALLFQPSMSYAPTFLVLSGGALARSQKKVVAGAGTHRAPPGEPPPPFEPACPPWPPAPPGLSPAPPPLPAAPAVPACPGGAPPTPPAARPPEPVPPGSPAPPLAEQPDAATRNISPTPSLRGGVRNARNDEPMAKRYVLSSPSINRMAGRSAASSLRSGSRLRFREFVRRNDKVRRFATVAHRGHVVFVPTRRAISKEPAPQTRALSGGRDDSPTFHSLLHSWLRTGTRLRGVRRDVPFGYRYRRSVFVRWHPRFRREQRLWRHDRIGRDG